jgi:hypothetical protein
MNQSFSVIRILWFLVETLKPYSRGYTGKVFSLSKTLKILLVFILFFKYLILVTVSNKRVTILKHAGT